MALSLAWASPSAFYVTATHHTAIEQERRLSRATELPVTAAIAFALLAPIVFLFSAAAMMRRAQEMRTAARP